MKDEEVIKKIIEKAVKNGYVEPVIPIYLLSREESDYYAILFDLKFAKALWRDEEWEWQKYLQQLAIAPNRIEYLKQFIE